MTKTEKKEIIIKLLREFIESGDPINSAHLIEKIIVEIYSSGFNTIGEYQIVSDSISNFLLKDFVTKATEKDTKGWTTFASVVSLLALIELSQLPSQ